MLVEVVHSSEGAPDVDVQAAVEVEVAQEPEAEVATLGSRDEDPQARRELPLDPGTR
jgi:hypothetical protein